MSPEPLTSLLRIYSPSGQEAPAVAFLVGWMQQAGFAAYVDTVGNAVGILDGGAGSDGQPPRDIILLGHIDTVPGFIPVEAREGRLYGRGAVDAKGPLAAFAVAAAQVGLRPGWRIVVIGALEEETTTSRGALQAVRDFEPTLVVIGEPSRWNRITLGYKGRILVDYRWRQPLAHRAGQAIGACEQAVAYWNRVVARIEVLNAGHERTFDRVLHSLRRFHSEDDGFIETADMTLGFRLPLHLGPEALRAELEALAEGAALTFSGPEQAYESPKNTELVRAFMAAIRAQGERPGFVLKTGTSDMNVVAPVWNCPILAYGPGDSNLDHTPTEHVVIAEWERGVRCWWMHYAS